MQNIHPLFVHFPIALTLSALLFEVLYWLFKRDAFDTTSTNLIVIAALAAIAALITGSIAGDSVPHPASVSRLIDIHGDLEGTGGSIAIAAALWTLVMKNRYRIVRLVLVALAAGIIGFGASYGGRMVYEHGIGTALVTSKTVNAPPVVNPVKKDAVSPR
jgi:uncharacterized membrane protein